MELELISKKELLDLANISYGQLYRWKRKNLIPDDWFIRKSTFTGQETFFPKEKILARIEKIQNMKDDLSLDELADVFSPNISGLALTINELLEKKIVSEKTLQFFIEEKDFHVPFSFEDIVQVYLVDQLLSGGDITLDEARMLIHLLEEKKDIIKEASYEIVLIRKYGISSCLLIASQQPLYFEANTRVFKRLAISTASEQIKTKFLGGTINE